LLFCTAGLCLALRLGAAAVIIISDVLAEKMAETTWPDKQMPDGAFEAQAFDVTLLTPYGLRTIRVRAAEHIWDQAKAAGINLPAICHQGRCLTRAGKLVEPGEFDPSDAVSYYPQDREAGYILLCTAKARSNLRIRTHMQTEMRLHRKEIGLPAPYYA
jgi:ferredoxin